MSRQVHYIARPSKKAKRSRWPGLKLLLLLVLIIVLATVAWLSYNKFWIKPEKSSQPTASQQLAKNDFAVPSGQPQGLAIEAVGIDVPMGKVNLSQTKNGQLYPDTGVAAWYTNGPKPGAAGPAVIVGHVDSKNGPDVFWDLHKVEDGDEIAINYPDNKLTFTVTKTATAPLDQLPTAKIWNKTDKQVLRLITCIGDFNEQTQNYENNFIVYAKQTAITAQ